MANILSTALNVELAAQSDSAPFSTKQLLALEELAAMIPPDELTLEHVADGTLCSSTILGLAAIFNGHFLGWWKKIFFPPTPSDDVATDVVAVAESGSSTLLPSDAASVAAGALLLSQVNNVQANCFLFAIGIFQEMDGVRQITMRVQE